MRVRNGLRPTRRATRTRNCRRVTNPCGTGRRRPSFPAITGREEEETFLTDDPPTSKTPAHGSSNAGINKLHANQDEPESRKRR